MKLKTITNFNWKDSGWKTDVQTSYLVTVGLILILVALALGYLAAGWKLRPANDVEVHVRKLGPSSQPGQP